jgi:hypothetical protein
LKTGDVLAMYELKEEVRRTLRRHALYEDDLAESKSAEQWWNGMSKKMKSKVSSVLGLSKGKESVLFLKMSPGEKNEIEAYFGKHRGKVESVE